MIQYRVTGGIAKIGPGQVLALSGQQIKDRRQSLELPAGYQLDAKNPRKEKPPAPQDAEVKTRGPVEFKVGEIIGLPELPRNLRDIVEPVAALRPGGDGKAAVKSDKPGRTIDRVAAEKPAVESGTKLV